jgi:hypothetical protein
LLLTLRAYEQRAQSKAALHDRLRARHALTSRTNPRRRPAAAAPTPDAHLEASIADDRSRAHDREAVDAPSRSVGDDGERACVGPPTAMSRQ